MNRRSFAHTGISALFPALIVAMTLLAWAPSQAAPLATLYMEGRRQGVPDWRTFIVDASLGDVIEYRLLADMSQVGTQNGTNNTTITSLTPGIDGLNALSITLRQSAPDVKQAHFVAPGMLLNGWDGGIGASGGNPSPRVGTLWNDLLAIRPNHPAGVFSGINPEVILQGTFTLAADNGIMSFVTPSWGSATGAMRINGSELIFITAATQQGFDPVIAFSPLALGFPEPSTIALAAVGLIGVLAAARRRRHSG